MTRCRKSINKGQKRSESDHFAHLSLTLNPLFSEKGRCIGFFKNMVDAIGVGAAVSYQLSVRS